VIRYRGEKILPECKGGDEMSLVSARALKHPVGQIRKKKGERKYVLEK
jgi:hypothetical protein